MINQEPHGAFNTSRDGDPSEEYPGICDMVLRLYTDSGQRRHHAIPLHQLLDVRGGERWGDFEQHDEGGLGMDRVEAWLAVQDMMTSRIDAHRSRRWGVVGIWRAKNIHRYCTGP